MLRHFCDWAGSIVGALSKIGATVNVTVGEASDNPSARLDVDTSCAIARITCWESGDYDAEIIDIKSEQYLYTDRGRLTIQTSLSDQFQRFFEILNKAASIQGGK